MKFDFHPDALEEYQSAAEYYRGEREGLELRFIESIENAILRVVEAPSRWPVYEPEIRRCLARVFPYAVLYAIEPEGYWRSRKVH